MIDCEVCDRGLALQMLHCELSPVRRLIRWMFTGHEVRTEHSVNTTLCLDHWPASSWHATACFDFVRMFIQHAEGSLIVVL
jgi:hypothetical protein